MKHKGIYTLIVLLISLSSIAQNWDVFNKTYRYNYVYGNNALVTNVLFVDSTRQVGNDTLYNLNRIGVECNGACPTITTAITTTATVIVRNMPQFLQRKIIKYANNLVMLTDTAKLIIKPNCVLNEIWLFDSINNKTAQCINIDAQNIFSNLDSLKTILIDGTDTLILSKSFGIIQFPDLYNKNKYYKLAGIENKATYDKDALFGLKVPNVWDFYNFDVGDVFCYHGRRYYPNGGYEGMLKNVILSKTLFSDGYIYSIGTYEISQSDSWSNMGNVHTNTNSYTVSTQTYSFTQWNYSISQENLMYPGKVFNDYSPYYIYEIAKFGTDNMGRFYKYAGPSCSTYNIIGYMCATQSAILFPNAGEPDCYYYLSSASPIMQPINNGEKFSLMYGQGLGVVNDFNFISMSFHLNELTYAKKNGTDYFGTECNMGVGIKESSLPNQEIEIYPNPANIELTINSKQNEITKIELLNNLGQIIFSKSLNNSTTILNLTEYSNGLYFLKVFSNNGALVKKFLIEH